MRRQARRSGPWLAPTKLYPINASPLRDKPSAWPRLLDVLLVIRLPFQTCLLLAGGVTLRFGFDGFRLAFGFGLLLRALVTSTRFR
jgi:hypothetical protein